MGETIGLPRINEVAAYLDRYAPQVQAALRQREPAVSDLLITGTFGGDEDAENKALRDGLVVRAKVLDSALEEAIGQSKIDVAAISARLSSLKRMRFAALLFGAVGSSSVIATAFAKPLAAVIGGVLALLASIAGLAAENLVLGQKNSEDTLRSTVSTLSRVIGEGSLTRKLLAALQSVEFDVVEMRNVIADANKLFGDLIAARAVLVGIA
jgi:hypothetical protein